MSELLSDLFPEEKSVPASVTLSGYIEQREYLIDGKMVTWQGDMNQVASPVYVRVGSELKQKIIGSTPLLTAKEALEALNAAVRAYDLGHGVWPMMSVSERIQHVELFLSKMREKRQEVVNLLMWEIGKALKDSEKEFDRTCDYIVDTINSLKQLDRSSSGFVNEQGIMAQIRRVPLGVALCMGPITIRLMKPSARYFLP